MTDRPAPFVSDEMRWYRAEVVARRSVTPRMVRVTLTGADFADFHDAGPDQRFKLFLPATGKTDPGVPMGADWLPRWRAQPDGERAVMRTYTVRAARPERAELDVDFTLHGDGPGATWANQAEPGDRAVLYGMRADYAPPPDTAWQLIAGDDSALPAISAILERLPADVPALVFVEVADEPERQPLSRDVTWLHRDRDGGLLDAITRSEFPAGPAYAWLAGESSAVKNLRRHLVERGVPAAAITFTGYWRQGGPIEQLG